MPSKKTYTKSRLNVSGLNVDVIRKNVKNLNLRIYPSDKSVRISVPRRIPEQTIIRFIESKLPWIRKHLSNYKKRSNQNPVKYISGEKHMVWGKELDLLIVEKNKPPNVYVTEAGILTLQVRPDSDTVKKASVLKEWYRAKLKKAIPELIQKWEGPMGVSVNEFGVKKMRTRWGTCNIRARRIWLNLELAKKRPELLEYVVVHEMVHLLERLHNARFYSLMERFLPNWKALKNELNGKSSISEC